MADRRHALIGHTHAAVSEVNDLSAAVTWANVPDANITESSVTQHAAAISTALSLNVANWDTAYGWGDHSGLYEAADAAIVKSDEAETITAAWDFDNTTSIETLRVRNAAGDDYCDMSHDGSNFQEAHTNSTWKYVTGLGSGGILNRSGAQTRWYDDADDDSIRIQHTGDWGICSHGNVTGGLGTRIIGGAIANRQGVAMFALTASDEGTDSITLPHGGGIYMIVGSNTSIAQANDIHMGYWQSTTVHGSIFDVAAGAISRGTGSNPDVDGDNNIWFTSGGTVMNIKNRRGSFRYYNLFVIGGDQ